MIPYTQITDINLGFFSIKAWGLIVAIGIATALVLALRRAKKEGLKKSLIYDLTFYTVLAGFIGARIGFVLFDWPATVPLTFLGAVNLMNGGLSFTFGLLGGVIAGFTYLKIKKANILKVADFLSPYIVLAHAISRVGCFLTGMHIGKETTSFFGVMVNGTLRHNVALYEVFILTIIFFVLLYLRRFKRFDGFVFASYLLLYSSLRFFFDFLRLDATYYGLTAAQYVLIGMFLAGLAFFAYKAKKALK